MQASPWLHESLRALLALPFRSRVGDALLPFLGCDVVHSQQPASSMVEMCRGIVTVRPFDRLRCHHALLSGPGLLYTRDPALASTDCNDGPTHAVEMV